MPRRGRGTVMGVLKKLIGLHRILFLGAALLTVASAAANLWWNSFLAGGPQIRAPASAPDAL